MKEIDVKALRTIMPGLSESKAAAYLPHLNAAMAEFGITNEARAAAFLAQLAHESTELNKWSENLNYTAKRLLQVFPKYFKSSEAGQYAGKPESIANRVYSNRMGNGPESSGDGWKYRGRSPIHLTGKENYQKAGQALGLDLVNNPNLAASVEVGFRIAGWFWNSRGLNELADSLRFKDITKRINGGYNGLAERQRYYTRALRAIPDDFVLDIDEKEDELPKVGENSDVTKPQPDASSPTNSSIIPVSAEAVTVSAVSPSVSGRLKRLWTTVLTALTGLGVSILQALGWLANNFEKHRTLIIIVAVIIAIYLIGQFVLDYKREDAAVELTKKQMDIISDRSKDNVFLAPPIAPAPDAQSAEHDRETEKPGILTRIKRSLVG